MPIGTITTKTERGLKKANIAARNKTEETVESQYRRHGALKNILP